MLPPCQSTLRLHLKRSNFISRIWKEYFLANNTLPDICDHGWNYLYEIQWIEDAFPDDVTTLLLEDDNDDDSDEEFGIDVASEESDFDDENYIF